MIDNFKLLVQCAIIFVVKDMQQSLSPERISRLIENLVLKW